MTFYFGLIILAVMIWKLFYIGKDGLIGLIGLQTILSAKKRRAIDASSLQIVPPPRTQQYIEYLKEVGFQRLGEAQMKLPFRPVTTIWIVVNSDFNVQAELGGGRVSFSTIFKENVLVVTDYPNGEHIETPTYQSHTITTTLKDTYRHHLEQVAKFSRQYGIPNAIRNMNDYYRWETMGRTQPYARMKLRRFLLIESVRLAVFSYGILVTTLPLLFYWLNPSFIPIGLSKEGIEILTIVLTLPTLFIPDLYGQWMMKGTHEDSANR